MVVSPALALMLTLGGVPVPPDGCAVVAVEEDGRAFATCTDPPTWAVFDPDLLRGGLWSRTLYEPRELKVLRSSGGRVDVTSR